MYKESGIGYYMGIIHSFRRLAHDGEAVTLFLFQNFCIEVGFKTVLDGIELEGSIS